MCATATKPNGMQSRRSIAMMPLSHNLEFNAILQSGPTRGTTLAADASGRRRTRPCGVAPGCIVPVTRLHRACAIEPQLENSRENRDSDQSVERCHVNSQNGREFEVIGNHCINVGSLRLTNSQT